MDNFSGAPNSQNVPNESAQNRRVPIDRYVVQQTEMLYDRVNERARRTAIQALADTVNFYLEEHDRLEDPFCCFKSEKTGKRCYHLKGKYQLPGSSQWYSSIYCTAPPMRHHQYVQYKEKKRLMRQQGSQPRQQDPQPRAPAPYVPAPYVPAPYVPAPYVPAPYVPAPNVPAPNVPAPNVPAPNVPAPNVPDDEDELSEILDFEDGEIQIPPSLRPVPTSDSTHTRIQEIEANARPDDTCTVCLDQLGTDRSNYCALICGHIFHRVCIDTWMAVPSHTCPICRSTVHSPRDVIDLTDSLMPDAPLE